MKCSEMLDTADQINNLAPQRAYLMSATSGIVHNNLFITGLRRR